MERNISRLPLVHSLTVDWTCNPGMCPDQELNQRPFALRDNAQPTEPPQSGQDFHLLFTDMIHLQEGLVWVGPQQKLIDWKNEGRKPQNIWKLKYILLQNDWVKKRNKWWDLNINRDKREWQYKYQNVWDAVKAEIKGKFYHYRPISRKKRNPK